MSFLYIILQYIPRHGINTKHLKRIILLFEMVNAMNRILPEHGLIIFQISLLRVQKFLLT
jgi:hypothetical protein